MFAEQDPVLLHEAAPLTVFSNNRMQEEFYWVKVYYDSKFVFDTDETTPYIQLKSIDEPYYKYVKQYHLYEIAGKSRLEKGCKNIPILECDKWDGSACGCAITRKNFLNRCKRALNMFKSSCCIVIFFLFVCHQSHAIKISGFVRDAQSGESLVGANIHDKTNHAGSATDTRGYFSLVTGQSCDLFITYIGYQTINLQLNLNRDTLIVIQMETKNELDELTITAHQARHFDVTRLSAKTLFKVPTIGGKPDVIKALQLLPGVQTTSEG